jgi:hypothetical protein
MTAEPPPQARKPENPPSLADLAERDQYAAVAAGSAATVRGSAKTWETALTAFITLITAGVIIKGRDSTADLTTAWRWAIAVLAGGGLLLAVAGLWLTVAAEAGTHPETKTLQDIRAAHGTFNAYQVYLAVRAAHRLRWGIRLAAVAMTLLITGVIATWLAPGPPTPSAYIEVTYGHSVTCGTPQPAPAGQLRISVPGQSEPAVIGLEQITALTLTAVCP